MVPRTGPLPPRFSPEQLAHIAQLASTQRATEGRYPAVLLAEVRRISTSPESQPVSEFSPAAQTWLLDALGNELVEERAATPHERELARTALLALITQLCAHDRRGR